MQERIIFAGFGGQGILFMGKLLCFTMMNRGLHVTYIPSYGAEMRGGTANCHVIVSDTPIASPLVTRATMSVVMNQPSYEKFKTRLDDGAFFFVNSSLVKTAEPPENVNILQVPATQKAHELGDVRLANMIMFGVINTAKKFMDTDYLFSQLPEFLGKKKLKFLDANKKAILEGERYAKEVLGIV
ncbi:MAG: 2-oxoacid:ferredoxin oxidoreductase subunit gamma [Planctomycetota bacterium]|nr:MAG: 2-oxoacid:ferredoxin oxidoreductase subunit gamma [Planctomycetota bacterium]